MHVEAAITPFASKFSQVVKEKQKKWDRALFWMQNHSQVQGKHSFQSETSFEDIFLLEKNNNLTSKEGNIIF